MSTILKALDRLEREKRGPRAKTLRQEVMASAAADPTPVRVSGLRNPTLLAALAVGLGIAVGGLGVWLAARESATRVAQAADAAAAAALPVSPEPGSAATALLASAEERDGSGAAAGVEADPAPDALAEAGGEPAFAVEPETAIEPEIEIDPEVAVAAADGSEDFAPGETPVLDPAEHAPDELEALAPVSVVAPPRVAQRRTAAAVAPRGAEPVARPEAKPVAAPPRRPASAAAPPRSASEPEVSVVSTVWHPAGERRHARVRLRSGETREVREGDRVEGLVVDRIEPSRVVFAKGGIELVRRVGSGR